MKTFLQLINEAEIPSGTTSPDIDGNLEWVAANARGLSAPKAELGEAEDDLADAPEPTDDAATDSWAKSVVPKLVKIPMSYDAWKKILMDHGIPKESIRRIKGDGDKIVLAVKEKYAERAKAVLAAPFGEYAKMASEGVANADMAAINDEIELSATNETPIPTHKLKCGIHSTMDASRKGGSCYKCDQNDRYRLKGIDQDRSAQWNAAVTESWTDVLKDLV